jgi:methylated-DNA-[protein]-cysteine S-methyltransferase
MDHGYAITQTPIGDAVCVLSDQGIVALRIAGDPGIVLESVSRELRAAVVPAHDSEIARDAAEQLDGYFAGTLTEFSVPLDWRLVRGFVREALEAVCEIPYGATAGYGEVAAMAGRPRAARAVGTACRTTPFSLVVPVHRVIRADGSIGGYGGDEETKRFLLNHERDRVFARSE